MLAPVFSLLLTGAAGLVQHGPAIGPRTPAPLPHLSRAERPLAVATSKVLLDDDEEPQAEQVLLPPSDLKMIDQNNFRIRSRSNTEISLRLQKN